MPNDCTNHVTVYADSATIKALKEVELRITDILYRHKMPDDLRMYNYKLLQVGQGAICFRLDSAWAPANLLWEALLAEYADICFIKNEWYVEDGPAGVWIADHPQKHLNPSIQELSWDEGCLEEKAHRFREAKE